MDVSRRAEAVLAASQDLIVDAGAGIRLLAHYSPATRLGAGLAVLLHGWEGSAQSQYLRSMAATMYAAGYDVVRLNLRDHGPSHHLNRELFHSCRIEEVVDAIASLSRQLPGRRIHLVGYSLGGNFALRVALRAPGRGIPLDRAVAVCPVLDPAATMRRLEVGHPIYRQYFIHKWSKSLRRKQAAWPGQFDFTALLHRPTLDGMTRALVASHTDFPTIDAYLQGYALTGAALQGLSVPTLLLAAADDPIISPDGLGVIAHPDALTVDLQSYGGHCGFLEGLSGPTWADRRILDWLCSSASV